MKILPVGFVLGTLLTLTLAASVQEFEIAETNNNEEEETAGKCSIIWKFSQVVYTWQ